MPFYPTLPVNGTVIFAAELRGQFNALNDLIAAQAVTIAAQAAQITALWTALGNTAQNPNLSPMSLGLSDPPSQVQLQAIYDQLNTLLNQITRV